MIKYSHIKGLLLPLYLSIVCVLVSCHTIRDQHVVINVYHYPSEKLAVESLQSWILENNHSICQGVSQNWIKINPIALTDDNQIESIESKDPLLNRLQLENQIWAVNSTDLLKFDLLQTKQNHFVDDHKMMEAILSNICDPITQKSISVVYNFKLDSPNVDAALDLPKVPSFDEIELYEKAYMTFWKFAEAQNLIGNEKNDPIISELISNTVKLFISDQNIVQIQNANDILPIEITTEQYLHRMHALNRYDEIQIEWNQDLKVVMPWESQPSENPVSQSQVSGRQTFIGSRSGKISYSDQIDKTIDLHAKLVESIDITGNTVIEWQVFLGDIRVSSDPTTPIHLQT